MSTSLICIGRLVVVSVALLQVTTTLGCTDIPHTSPAPTRTAVAAAPVETPSTHKMSAADLVAAEEDAAAEAVRAAWIRVHAIPFDTVEAGNGFDDLEPLREAVGDARIVALGEGTHGTREFFQMKHRLLEFLASEMGFTIFAIEANMPEAHRLNEYVKGGEGDAAGLVGGMGFWTWNTEEVLEMVAWMREFNASGKGSLGFTGFDMQYADRAMDKVSEFVADADPEFADQLAQAYDRLRLIQRQLDGPCRIVGELPVDEARGKHLRLAGRIKTGGFDGLAGLMLRVEGPNGELLASGFARGAPGGATSWQQLEVDLDVPENAAKIELGTFANGLGFTWFDALAVELDERPYRDPDAFGFGFEADQLIGFSVAEKPCHTSIDETTSYSGGGSLRVARTRSAMWEGIKHSELTELPTEVLEHLENAQEQYRKRANDEEVAWAIQNARLVLQYMRLVKATGRSSFTERDASMAENVAWILDQDPEARIVLWAHNGHVARHDLAMGHHLAERYGDDYVPVAFATFEGDYYAMASGPGGNETVHVLTKPPTDSAEHLIGAAGHPRLILDLREADEASAASGWLTRPAAFRGIGALATENQFRPAKLAESYDLLIYIDETHAARQLSTPPQAPSGPDSD